MAARHVSGVAALIWSHFPLRTAKEIREALTSTAIDLGDPGRDDMYGYGLIQADAAFDFLSQSPTITPTTSPIGDASMTLSPTKPPTLPTSYPTKSPASWIDVDCVDTPNWHDGISSWYDCEFYNIPGECEIYGNQFPGVGNETANQACCACGGGSDIL